MHGVQSIYNIEIERLFANGFFIHSDSPKSTKETNNGFIPVVLSTMISYRYPSQMGSFQIERYSD